MARAKDDPTPSPADSTPPERLHLWQIQAVRDGLVLVIAVLIVWAGYAMRTVTVPLLVALLLAYLFEPLVARLSKRHGMSRPMVVGGLLLTVGAAFIALIIILVPLLVTQTMQLADDVRDGRFARSAIQIRAYVPESYRDEFDRMAAFFLPADVVNESHDQPGAADLADEENVPANDGAAPPVENADSTNTMPTDVAVEIGSLREEIAQLRAEMDQSKQPPTSAEEALKSGNLVEFVRRGLDIALAVVGQIISIGLLAFLIPFYFFFFSVSYPKVLRFGNDLIPEAHRTRAIELLKRMDHAVSGFVRGRIVIALIMSVLFAIGWSIVGVQYAIVLGFVIGFFSIVPYLGMIGIPLAIGLAWLGQINEPEAQRLAWYWIIIWPTAIFSFVQALDGYVLTPVIAGKATNLDPVTILVAVLAGGSIMGVYGMLLAIPVAACLKIVFVEVLLPRIKAWSAGRAADPLPIERG